MVRVWNQTGFRGGAQKGLVASPGSGRCTNKRWGKVGGDLKEEQTACSAGGEIYTKNWKGSVMRCGPAPEIQIISNVKLWSLRWRTNAKIVNLDAKVHKI